MRAPETVKPSIAMKCIAQMPAAPIEVAAIASQRARASPS
jgi:hypothetical protein